METRVSMSPPRAGPRRPAPAAPPKMSPKMSENAEKMSPTSRNPAPPPKFIAGAGVAEPVVLRALLGIGEDLVGLRRLLEAVLSLGVAGVAVGVQLHRHAAIGALELSGVDVSLDAQHFVVIPFLGHE